MKILLVEDDITLNQLITKALKRIKYSVEQTYDGEEAWEKYFLSKYDLLILDLNIPYIDGMELLKMIRNKDKCIKILILTAKGTIEDKVLGLNSGASDYLTKPFDLLELEARIDNLLRWNFQHADDKINICGLVLDKNKKEFTFENKSVALTRKEFGILEFLFLKSPTYVTTEEIIDKVWEGETALFSNTLKFHINTLRNKLKVTTSNKILITTKRGFGYSIKKNDVKNN